MIAFGGGINAPNRTFAVSCAEINTCHAHAQCTFVATEQRHKCQCNSGYEGDGYECSTIGKRVRAVHASIIFNRYFSEISRGVGHNNTGGGNFSI